MHVCRNLVSYLISHDLLVGDSVSAYSLSSQHGSSGRGGRARQQCPHEVDGCRRYTLGCFRTTPRTAMPRGGICVKLNWRIWPTSTWRYGCRMKMLLPRRTSHKSATATMAKVLTSPFNHIVRLRLAEANGAWLLASETHDVIRNLGSRAACWALNARSCIWKTPFARRELRVSHRMVVIIVRCAVSWILSKHVQAQAVALHALFKLIKPGTNPVKPTMVSLIGLSSTDPS